LGEKQEQQQQTTSLLWVEASNCTKRDKEKIAHIWRNNLENESEDRWATLASHIRDMKE
jgi:hypothetical protein